MIERPALEQFLQSPTEEAFCALFELVYPRVRRYFLLRGVDGLTTEELAQNVMFILYRRAVEIRDPERFSGWLFAVARHELIRHWRQARNKVATIEFEPLRAQLAAQLSLEAGVLQDLRLRDWLARLEPAERDLVVLRFVEDLSYEDLSLALSLPLGTVKWRLFQVKRKLAIIIATLSADHLRQFIN